jgi:hypothetical protein
MGGSQIGALSIRIPQRATFRLLQWRWRLVGVTLPESIQNLLADELIKSMKAPKTPP